MQSRLNVRSPLALFLLGLSLFVVFGSLWWFNVYRGPKRTFNDMLVNNLTTGAVTKDQFISSNGQTSVQRNTLQFGADNTVRSIVTIRSTSGSATTETIGKKGVAYVRYTDIVDAQKHDFSKVLNIWAKSGNDAATADLPKLFDQSVLDVTAAPIPPLGAIDGTKRSELLAYIKDQQIFTPSYGTVKTTTVNGRQGYTYAVSVKLAPYLRLMQEFSHVYGLTDLDQISPSDYQSTKPVTINITVDRLSHQMIRISDSSGFNQTYTDYGIVRNIPVPSKTISTAALRHRLQAAQ